MVFEIYREQQRSGLARTTRWQWRLKADSERTIAFGQGYVTRKQAERAIATIRDARSTEARTIVAKRQHH